jgi:subtilisin-like proprotein convertase family protein/subtilisin family serine protease
MAKKKRAQTSGEKKDYTYRCGKRVELIKRPDQFVVRQLPDALPENMAGEQMSSASTRVTCDANSLESLMSEARRRAPTHHAYQDAETGSDFLITDRVIVTFTDEMDPVAVGQFAGKYALELVERISSRDYLFRLMDETGMNPVKLVNLLTESDDLVANVDHDLNQVFRKSQLQLPTDPTYEDQWHLHQRRQSSSDYDPRASARVEAAWQLLDGFGEHDVVIGVTDDGCQIDHDDFDSADKFAGWGFFSGTSLIRRGDVGASADDMYVDGDDHGTACAGVIAADADGELTVGAAPGCRLLPIRWPSSGPSLYIGDTRLRRALNYMNSRVDVISNSWGSVPTSTWAQTTLNLIDEMVQSGGRRGRGVVFLWAAGNENCPISHVADQDVPVSNGWEIYRDIFGILRRRWVGFDGVGDTARRFRNDLANRDGVMHVAALASTAQRSHYSNYGTGIDICAPTSNSHRYWRLDLPGLGITTTEGRDAITDSFGGTSSATPLVAGIAGLVISANPNLTALEVIRILKETASKDLNMTAWPSTPPATYDPNPNWDVSPIDPFDSGDFTDDHGFDEGTWSPWFGHGRVDAHAAVARALELAGKQTVHLNVSRQANLAIPDRDPAGVVSRIQINQRGRVVFLKVKVDITHSWIGDLIVRLVGPDGHRGVLHYREGNNTHNISKTYDLDSTPELTRFQGVQAQGAWSLEVSDRASADTGLLREWGIEAEVQVEDELRVESASAAVIPDNDPAGITDTINVTDNRVVSSLAVEVDISHSWRGDLLLQLVGPGGESVTLHSFEGRDQDNIQRTYRIADIPDLSTFVGHSASGDWTLKVSDHAGEDVGKLNHWALLIK